MEAPKPMRQTMPTVAAWVDELRAAFGAEVVNRSIRNGAAGGTWFWARENGSEIGQRPSPGKSEIDASALCLGKIDPKTCRCTVCVAARSAGNGRGRA